MKKRVLALALSVLIAASLAGCSGQLSNEYITVKKYEGLEVPKVDVKKVTDGDVNNAINSKLKEKATIETVTGRAAQKGDTVNIDYKGSIDGKEFDGGSATGASLELGSGASIGANGNYKGFEEQIEGHNIGDKFDVTVQFPAQYSAKPDLQNKVAVFNVTLNGIVKIPKLTNAWVKENSKTSKTVDEYKKETKTDLEKSSKKSTESSLQSSVMDALVDQVEVKKYPAGAVDKQLKDINKYYNSLASAYKLDFKDFLKQYMGLSEKNYKKEAKKAAEATVKRDLACKLIAKKKKLEPTKEEYDAQVKEYAKGSGVSVDDFKKQVGEETLKSSILQQKVAKYLADKCVQVEKSDTDTKGTGK